MTGVAQGGNAAHKVVVIIASLCIVPMLTGSIWPLVALITSAALSFCMILFFDRLSSNEQTRRKVAGGWTISTFLLLILMNAVGIIGTLTSGAESLSSQWILTIGSTFYLVQICGAASSILRNEMPMPKLIDYFMFVTFGLKFYSGPLEKAFLIQQFENYTYRYDGQRWQEGLSWFVLGVFMVTLISNPIQALNDQSLTDPVGVIFSAFILELRVYFNFAGYSFVVYGLSKAIGIDLTLNFNHPFFATDLKNFWHRWHISLGQWFHHYVYGPIRATLPKQAKWGPWIAAFIFFLSALWHGATLNYLMWAFVHALAFLTYLFIFSRVTLPIIVSRILLFVFLVFTRILASEANTERLLAKLAGLFSPSAWTAALQTNSALNVFLGSNGTLQTAHLSTVALALAFLFGEWISIKRYPDCPYGLFRTKWAVIFLAGFVLINIQSGAGGFVYARQ
jgi:D-alanyl-lipoteichoic acid acyltransferase DltB (MBOAT superfamily)